MKDIISSLKARIEALRQDALDEQRGEYESGYLWALDHVDEALDEERKSNV